MRGQTVSTLLLTGLALLRSAVTAETCAPGSGAKGNEECKLCKGNTFNDGTFTKNSTFSSFPCPKGASLPGDVLPRDSNLGADLRRGRPNQTALAAT